MAGAQAEEKSLEGNEKSKERKTRRKSVLSNERRCKTALKEQEKKQVAGPKLMEEQQQD